MSHSTNKRIAKNTLMLYFRHILIMFVTLYTVRVVLETLGVEDYGIYNVVGGVVALFSFFSNTMASASQRFFSFAIGKRDEKKLADTFAVNWIIYAFIAITAFILLETIGLWFIYNKLVIPEERINAAIWIYQFSVFSFMCTILTTPFMAMIIAHEDMNIYAYVSIFEALLKLGIVFILVIISWDKLKLYGILIFISTLIISIIYFSICKKKYTGCKFRFIWNKNIFRDVFSFTGWSVFGSVAVVVRNQAVTILLNQMFNPAVVAARSIANQISNNVNIFSSNFNTGLYPSIIKNYAAGENGKMLNLIFNGSKITYFLMYLFTVPLFLEMPYIISIWLKNPPSETIIFARLALLDSLVTAISLPLMTAVRATGKVKAYELTLGSILIASFFVSWFLSYRGLEAYVVMIVAIVTSCIMLFFRLILLKRVLSFPVFRYVKGVLIPVIFMSFISFPISFFLSRLLPDNFLYICISVLSSLIIICVSMYCFAFDRLERKKIQTITKNLIRKIIFF